MAAIIAQITRNNRERKRKESMQYKEGIKCVNKLPDYEDLFDPKIHNKYLARSGMNASIEPGSLISCL